MIGPRKTYRPRHFVLGVVLENHTLREPYNRNFVDDDFSH